MQDIPRHLPPRSNLVPIKNKYLPYKGKYKLHAVMYYIDNTHARLIVRRMDKETGWENKIIMLLYDIDKKNVEKIPIEACSENAYENIITTETILFPTDLSTEQLIPKTIIQTYISTKPQSLLHYNTVIAFHELNPEYEYVFFDDTDCRKFIKAHFPQKILDAYDILVPGAFKSDLFRYCYLYKNGGCYFDCKLRPIVPLRDIIKSKEKMILCKDPTFARYYNAVMMSVSSHPILSKVIETCANIILNRVYTGSRRAPDALAITGPSILYDVIKAQPYDEKKEISISLRMNRFIIRYHCQIIIDGINPDYYQNIKERYGRLYDERKIYYEGPYNLNQYSIYIYPHVDKFSFEILNGQLIIKRTDEPNLDWGQDLRLKIINHNDETIEIIDVGMSHHSVKDISLKAKEVPDN